jgi:predicted chitinase
LNALADKDDIETLTGRINKAKLKMQERKANVELMKKLLQGN